MARGLRRTWRRIFAILVTLLVAGSGVLWYLVIPGLIKSQVEAETGGKTTFTSWWIHGRSSGLTGLTIHETHSSSSPIRFKVASIATDVSFSSLLQGRVLPKLVTIDRPDLTLRFDSTGNPIALPESKSGGKSVGPVPEVIVSGGRVTIAQEGKQPLSFDRFDGAIRPKPDGSLKIDAVAVGERWGTWTADGLLSADFAKGRLSVLQKEAIPVDRETLHALPFVPPDVANQVELTGPIKATLHFDLLGLHGDPARIQVEMNLGPEGSIKLPAFELEASHALAQVKIDGGIVELKKFEGRMLGGKVVGSGSVSFEERDPKFAIDVNLQEIDLADAPLAWKIEQLGAKGTISGDAKIRLVKTPEVIDLTGTTGELRVDGASIRNLPIKALHARISPAEPAEASSRSGPIVLPSVLADLELEDLPFADVIREVEAVTGTKLTLAKGGKLSLAIKANIPAGSPEDLKRYQVMGEASLTSATLDRIHFQDLKGKVALKDGLLNINDLHGFFVERSGAEGEGPTTPLPRIPTEGTLPPGAFRGRVLAQLFPQGEIEANIESQSLPIHEFTAPFFDGKSPWSGSLSVQLRGRSEVSALADYNAWTIDGKIDSQKITSPTFEANSVHANLAMQGRKIAILGLTGDLEQRPIKGKIDLEAELPETPRDPYTLKVTLRQVETAALNGLVPEGRVTVSGIADGAGIFKLAHDGSTLDGFMDFNAPTFRLQNKTIEAVRIYVAHSTDKASYELTAQTAGGKFKLVGELPLAVGIRELHKETLDAELHVVGFTLEQIWKMFEVHGPITTLEGETALAATIRLDPKGKVWLNGMGEARRLQFGPHYSLGTIKGGMRLSPEEWWIDHLEGELFGGVASGKISGNLPTIANQKADFEVKIDRASIPRALALWPSLAEKLGGYGTLKVEGKMARDITANADLFVPRLTVMGFPLTEVRLPMEAHFASNRSSGLLHLRHWNARVAGGRLLGEANFRIGEDKTYSVSVRLSDLDLEPLAKLDPEARRPSSGRLSGKLSLSGSDPANIAKLKGRVNLSLSDASLVDIAVFREIDKFLGSARGGLFDSGSFDAAISNKTINIDSFTLSGKLAQLHTTGTVGFNGVINLEVLVNTNEIIPQTGATLIGLIPGLREALGRQREEVSKVSGYLSNRLLKLRVTGTVRSPSVNVDSGVAMGEAAVGFFADVLKIPLGILRPQQ